MKLQSEQIVTLWRFGYFKLFNTVGLLENDVYVQVDDHEYRQLVWRLYWRLY